MSKPNILWVFADQHRFCDLGCYGNPQVETPHLDAFARQGVVMENFYSNCPVCVPARGTMFTGVQPLRHGAASNDLRVRPGQESIADVLRRAGYDTAYIGKWHLGGVPRDRFIPPAERLGFHYWRACNCNHDYYHAWYDDNDGNRFRVDGYEPAAQTELALDYLRTRAEDGAPWAMVLSYGTPHDPYELVPPAYKRRYLERGLDFRGNVAVPAVLARGRLVQADELRDWYAGYYAHISALDDQFGRLTAYLEERGLMENTVVLYTSDHGDMLGSQGLTNKQLPYEESAHIPMILRYDGHVRPGRRRQLMSLVDLAPTLAGLVGLSFQGEVDGLDLHNLFLHPEAPGAPLVYLSDLIPCHQACDRGGREWRAVRDARFTYARTPYDAGWLLFDNLADPLQRENLIGRPEYAEDRRRLDAALLEQSARFDAFLPWDALVRRFGLTEGWNESQAYFSRPPLAAP